MKYKKQHYITEAYIKAWCDPQTPNGAFVWLLQKKTRKFSMKSPRSLFSEDDFYTFYDSENNRVLEIEHRLQDIEDRFLSLRKNTLENRQPLSEGDRQTIALFASTMYARGKRQKIEGIQIWKEYLEMVDSLPTTLSLQIKSTKDYQQVKDFHSKQPLLFHLYNFVNITAPFLYRLNCAIYETKLKQGFITCDNPCFWYDPEILNPNKPVTFFGVGSPTLNVIMPISPRQYISLEKGGPDGYINLNNKPEIEKESVDLFNTLIAGYADDFIVTNQKNYNENWLG
jgi:hypothetical protein